MDRRRRVFLSLLAALACLLATSAAIVARMSRAERFICMQKYSLITREYSMKKLSSIASDPLLPVDQADLVADYLYEQGMQGSDLASAMAATNLRLLSEGANSGHASELLRQMSLRHPDWGIRDICKGGGSK